ncbi:MAG: DMT family transporter [Candidatus Promineofilum sp.]|nr:DMT family transporter [Promineifilum sp.]
MKPIHYGALLLLGAVWGASFLFIGVAAPEFGPLSLMFARVLVAGLLMLGVAILTQRGDGLRATLRLRQNWRTYLIVGLFNSALPFTLIAFSELRLTASLAAILNSTTPLFTALVAAVWGSERLTGRKVWGVVLGVVGVAVLVGGAPLAINGAIVLAVLASLLAALSYGTGTVYAARHITGLPAATASTVQLLGAAVILAAPGALALPAERPSSAAVGALAALILLSTTFAYLLYFFLLKNIGPTRTASVTFLVPVFGSVWAILFLREPFSVWMLLGMAIILTSVGLVTSRRADPVRPLPGSQLPDTTPP